MYTVYISDYLRDGSYVSEPALMYDTKSPAKDITVLDPVCDLEDSKAGSFSFTIPMNHYLYEAFVKKRTIVTIIRDDDIPDKRKIIFEGPVTSVGRDLYMNKEIYCEGFPTFLNDTCQPRKEYFGIFFKDYVEALINEHNAKYLTRERKFEVIWDDDNVPYFPNTDTYETTLKNVQDALNRATPGTEEYDIIKHELDVLLENRSEYQSMDIANISSYESTQYESTFSYIQELQDRCGAHIIFGVNDDSESECKYTIKVIRKIPDPVEGAQEVRFGVNMTDYTDIYNFSNLCTAILPVASANNYASSDVGEAVAMVVDPSMIVGEFRHLTEKITVDGVERYEFTDQNTNNGDYIYVLNSWPNRDAFFSDNGAHHLLKIIDKTKLADTVTDPDERWKAFEIISRSSLVYLGTVLGHPDGNSTAVHPISFNRQNGENYYTAAYRRYECFPDVTNTKIYYISSMNYNEAWIGNGSSGGTAVSAQTAAYIWAMMPYHVVSYFIPYYVYKGTVATYNDLPTSRQIANEVYYVIEQSRQGYYSLDLVTSTWFKVDAVNRSHLDARTPAAAKLYASTRAVDDQLIDDYTTNFIYSISYVGKELERKQMSTTADAGTWNSLYNQEFIISIDSGAEKYYESSVLNVAGWGGSINTVIRKGSYEYRVPDYSIGDLLTPSTYESYNDDYDSLGTPNAKITWPDGVLNGYLAYNRIGYYGNGSCVHSAQGGATKYYDISSYDDIYVTTRVAEQYYPNHGNECLWMLVDSSNQVIYCEQIDQSHVTTEINKLIDKNESPYAGACGLIVNRWGNVDIEVHECIKQTGVLKDYITAEGAEDYYYYNYAQHVDRTKTHTKGSLYVENPKMIDIYGRIEKKVEFNNIGDPNDLVIMATNYLMETQFDEIEINLTGVDMHNLELDVDAFDISTSVPTYSHLHGIDKNMPITSLRIALNSPQDNAITLGEKKKSLEVNMNG